MNKSPKKTRLVNPVKNPRYDAVYEDGIAWLDDQGNEQFMRVTNKEMKIPRLYFYDGDRDIWISAPYELRQFFDWENCLKDGDEIILKLKRVDIEEDELYKIPDLD